MTAPSANGTHKAKAPTPNPRDFVKLSRNLYLEYGSRLGLDALALHDALLCLVDWKTGRNRVRVSLRKLSKMVGAGRNTILKAIQRLEYFKAITVERHRTRAYTFVLAMWLPSETGSALEPISGQTGSPLDPVQGTDCKRTGSALDPVVVKTGSALEPVSRESGSALDPASINRNCRSSRSRKRAAAALPPRDKQKQTSQASQALQALGLPAGLAKHYATDNAGKVLAITPWLEERLADTSRPIENRIGFIRRALDKPEAYGFTRMNRSWEAPAPEGQAAKVAAEKESRRAFDEQVRRERENAVNKSGTQGLTLAEAMKQHREKGAKCQK
jgi:hypothetical protein